MNQKNLSAFLPHLGVIVAFIALLMLYFSPLISGKVILQNDIIQNRGMGKELADYREQTGKEALWTDAMFGGMPAFQIATLYPGNLFSKIETIITLGLPNPAKQIFMMFVGFYLLLVVCGVKPLGSAVGAFAFAFSSYFFIILEAGHNTKAMTSAYIAPIVAGVILAYRGRLGLGAALTLLGLALQVSANHIQITYYMGIILIGIAIAALVEALNKEENGFFQGIDMSRFVKASAILLLVAGLAVLPNISRLWTTYEYTEVTMRGKGELANTGSKDGLDREYALRWSYGIGETFNIMIPNLYGGASGSPLSSSSATYKILKNQYGEKTAQDATKQFPTYWGDQPFTSGPTYIGAAIVFLFILSLVLGIKNKGNSYLSTPFAVSMLVVTLLAIMLAWGRHFPILTNIFFDYFPLYNKFRAVAMILVVAQFLMPFLGILAIAEITHERHSESDILSALKIALGIAGGLVVAILMIGYTTWTFAGTGEGGDAAQLGAMGIPKELVPQLVNALIDDRRSMMLMDTLRALLWIGGSAAVIWLYAKKTIKTETWVYAGIGLIVLVDLWTVNRRYLNNDNFVTKSRYQQMIAQTTPADEAVLQDKSHYRVLNMASNTFNDALTSYHHKSIGGYHPAKLRRYQDLIDASIQPEMQKFGGALNKTATDSSIRAAFAGLPVLNMLDAKYVIYNKEAKPLLNPSAMGNAWFVTEIKTAATPDEELSALKTFAPAKTAIIGKDFEAAAAGTIGKDSAATIKLLEYKPNYLKYESNNSKEGLAVFSEIYYAKGWNAKIDGKDVPHLRANYVLRALKVPAGKHTIEFSFAPKSYIEGEMYALIGSILVLLVIAGLVFWDMKSRKQEA